MGWQLIFIALLAISGWVSFLLMKRVQASIKDPEYRNAWGVISFILFFIALLLIGGFLILSNIGLER